MRNLGAKLGLAAAALVAGGCQYLPAIKSAPSESETALIADVSRDLTAISDAYTAQDWRAHADATIRLLYRSRRVPIDHLVVVDDTLHAAIDAHGVEPYVSYLLDHGYRCRRAATKPGRKCFDRLRDHYAQRRERDNVSLAPVGFLADVGPGTYRSYSENAILVSADLLFSEFGDYHVDRGVTPSGFLRIAEAMSSCQDLDDATAERVETARILLPGYTSASRPCDILRALLNGGAGGAGAGGVVSLLDGGVRTSFQQCQVNESEREFMQRIQDFEDYRACMESTYERSDRRPGFTNHAALASGAETWSGRRGNGTVEGSATRNADGTYTLKEVERNAGGQVTSVEETTIDPTTGAARTVVKDGQGNVTHMHTQGPGGVTHHDGSTENGWVSETVEYHPNGTPKTVSTSFTDENGTKTTFTEEYDEDGNVTSSETTTEDVSGGSGGGSDETTTPDPNSEEGQCGHVWQDKVRGSPRRPYGIDPSLIYPVEGSPGYSPAFVGCLDLAGNDSGRTQCQSAAYCLEGVDPVTCRCTSSGGTGIPPPNAGVCAQIMCGEGSECDASTGMCRSYGQGGGLVLPGVALPEIFGTGGGSPLRLPADFFRGAPPVGRPD